MKERLAILNETVINIKNNMPQKSVKIHWEKTIEKIYLEDDRIGLKFKREDLETDYLIFCYSNTFYNDLVKGMKEYDPKKSKNFEDVSRDFIRMSHKITDHLTAFRDLDPISFPQILITFRKKFWNSVKEDIILIHEVDQPFLMLLDLSKTSRELPHLLFICKASNTETESHVDDEKKKKIYKVRKDLFVC